MFTGNNTTELNKKSTVRDKLGTFTDNYPINSKACCKFFLCHNEWPTH